MASDAEVDLIVNATRALAGLQADLDRLVRTAENNTDPVRVQAALNQLISLRRVEDDLQQVIRTAQARADTITVRADVDTDDADRGARRLGDTLGNLGRTAGSVLGPLAGLAGGVAAAGAAAGTAAPLLAGVVVAVESILPAAALATSGLLTLQLASVTLKIGMIGVKDAIATAFDPDASPEDLAKSLEKLGPHAKSFVQELQGMRKGFKAIQIDVQNRLFANLDTSLARTAKATLPSLHGALDRTADSLNDMARGAASAAQELGEKGILGSALASSTGALSKLEQVPGQVILAFGQLAAASGPALEGLAARAGGVADRISEKLSKAFASGALEKSINEAIANIEQLGRIAGNIFGGIGNIIKAVTVDGEGLFGTLEKVTQAFEDLTASKEFQGALQALSKTMATLVSAVLPLLQTAFQALLPIFEILAPPIQDLIKHLGAELQPVIAGLAPVLESLATAFVKLIPVLTPIIDLGLKLIELVLPILTVLFEHLGEVFERLQPIVEQVAENLITQLEPILAKLPGILEQILPQFLEIADKILPLLLDVLVELSPSLLRMSEALADLLIALTPLIVKFLEFQVFLLTKMMPLIAPLAELIAGILVGALGLLTNFINNFVIPAVNTIVALLNGDFQGALRNAAQFINNLRENARKAFEGLKGHAVQVITTLGAQIVARIISAKDQFVGAIGRLVQDAINRMAQLPIGILNVLSGVGNLLFSIGSDLVQGLINGITSRIGGVVAAAAKLASSIPSTVKGLLGISSPSKVMIGVGDDVMAGLLKGISAATPELRKQLGAVALSIPQTVISQGKGLAAGRLSPSAPMVNVYLGNQRLTQFMDYRIDSANRRDTVIAAQGVRR